ncbi:MAG: hypothetical protein WC976_06075 [Caldisericia bacterium]
MSGYGTFLMVELARVIGIIPKKLEYDLTWEKGKKLLAEFLKSKYNKPGKSLYECIEEFLNNKRRIFK